MPSRHFEEFIKHGIMEVSLIPGSTTHFEPDCMDSKGCHYMEPHHHGFACDETCEECQGKCHPACPQHPDNEDS